MATDPVVVLDLGSTHALALAAQWDEEQGLCILGVGSAPCRGMKRGVVNDLEEVARAADSALRGVQTSIGRSISKVTVSVSGTQIEAIDARGLKPIHPRGRLITHQDVLEVINHSRAIVLPPDREQIQALPKKFVVDGIKDVMRPIGTAADRLEVISYVVTGDHETREKLEQLLALNARTLEQMVYAPIAAGVGVLAQDELSAGSAVLDIGAGKSELGIFLGGSIAYAVTLPIGGGHVTSDLALLLKTSPEEAERLKLSSGHARASEVSDNDSVEVTQVGQGHSRPMQRHVLCEIIESRMRELAVMVRQHMDRSGTNGKLLGGLTLTGGGSRLAGVEGLFEEVLTPLRAKVAEPSIRHPELPPYGAAIAVGMAMFTLQSYEELEPASGFGNWQDRVKSLFSFLGRG